MDRPRLADRIAADPRRAETRTGPRGSTRGIGCPRGPRRVVERQAAGRPCVQMMSDQLMSEAEPAPLITTPVSKV